MNFLAKFKKICREIDEPKVKILVKPRYETATKEKVRLFDIHKRSLPPGIDTVVLIGLTKVEAERWLADRLKAHVFNDDSRDSKTLIYYDMLPQDATPHERNIYFNSDETKRVRDISKE